MNTLITVLALVTVTAAPKQAPALFLAKIETTKGEVLVEVHREWAPHGADRFYELAKSGFYDGNAVFSVVGGWLFGIPGDPKTAQRWADDYVAPDAPAELGNGVAVGLSSDVECGSTRNRGTTRILIASRSRSTQCIAPFGRVISGAMILDKLDESYGFLRRTLGPLNEERLENEGEAAIAKDFPKVDRVVRITIVTP